MSLAPADTWEATYSSGAMLNRYPWDTVVSFIMQNRPRDRDRSDVGIVELGCGAAPNLWFAAREGFRVAGIDISQSAIDFARARFAEDGLEGDLQVGDFASLPFDDQNFSLAIDRAALTHTSDDGIRLAVQELYRVLEPGGQFFCNVYSTQHSSAESGHALDNGMRRGLTKGTLTRAGDVRFYDEADLLSLFDNALWETHYLRHLVEDEHHGDTGWERHAEWRLVVRRRG